MFPGVCDKDPTTSTSDQQPMISVIIIVHSFIKVYRSPIFTSDVRDVDIHGSPHTLFRIISVILSPKHPPTRRRSTYLVDRLDNS
jgi:hypothetical protein